MSSRSHLALLLVGGVGLTALLTVSCGTLQRTVLAPPPTIEGAVFIGNAQCYLCHSNYTREFPASAHGRLRVEGAHAVGDAGCESCHGPGSKHVIAGGGRGRFIVNPGRNPAACYSCHLETQTEFALPQHHPVPEGKMNCVQCHDPHGGDNRQPARLVSVARANAGCGQCHREQVKHVIYPHDALRDGCTTCHAPHGSINAKLLVERDANLCVKCHAQAPGPAGEIFFGSKAHRARLAQVTGCSRPGCHSTPISGPPCGCGLAAGACWSAGCHSAPHGSNVNPYLLY
jgi:DmsE family decaheme c-type cytochrome